jgi:hypothetical protein
MAVALAPPVAAGILLFHERAALMAAVAVVLGGAVGLIARLAHLPGGGSAMCSAVIGVALCGPLAPYEWTPAIALSAAIAEVLRSRFWPSARIATGVLAYGCAYAAAGGAVAAYERPAQLGALFAEPIQLWSRFFGGAARPIEPVTLYVGNVAGPVFCTSLLAVAIGLAWLWYARRLSLACLIGFGVAGAGLAFGLRWDPVFQLDSGPAWFVAGYALADRRLLPAEPVFRPMLAVAAAVFGIGLRADHYYIEALFLAVAGVQVVFSLVEVGVRFLAPRVAPAAGRLIGRRRTRTEPVSG